MDKQEIFEVMYKHLKHFNDDLTQETLATTKVADILETSLDVVELMIELEDSLGLEQDELEMEKLVPKFEKLNFMELAEEILSYLPPEDES